MNNIPNSYEQAQEIDLRDVMSDLWKAKVKILAFTVTAGIVTFAILSTMKPEYSAEAKILIKQDDSGFTRPTFQGATGSQNAALDKAAIVSEVQILQSNDLADEVTKELGLETQEDFATRAQPGFVKRLLISLGLSQDRSVMSRTERVREQFAKRRKIYHVADSRVIAVQFQATDPDLAPQVANMLADKYVALRKRARLEQTTEATSWLKEQIDVLRVRVAKAEKEVAEFQSENGLVSGSNNVRLDKQKLSEINSQLILATARRSEAEARAKLIQKMLQQTGDIKEFSDVLRSGLIQRLLEQRVGIQRRLSQMSSVYLPSHPAIGRVRSELKELQGQIRRETRKIMVSVENEAAIARTREASLKASLAALTKNATIAGVNKARLQALQREAGTSRKLLEAYLSRYREAVDRDDRALPSMASVISHAKKSSIPTFPRKGPFIILGMVGAFLLSLAVFGTRAVLKYAPGQMQKSPSADRARKEVIPGKRREKGLKEVTRTPENVAPLFEVAREGKSQGSFQGAGELSGSEEMTTIQDADTEGQAAMAKASVVHSVNEEPAFVSSDEKAVKKIVKDLPPIIVESPSADTISLVEGLGAGEVKEKAVSGKEQDMSQMDGRDNLDREKAMETWPAFQERRGRVEKVGRRALDKLRAAVLPSTSPSEISAQLAQERLKSTAVKYEDEAHSNLKKAYKDAEEQAVYGAMPATSSDHQRFK